MNKFEDNLDTQLGLPVEPYSINFSAWHPVETTDYPCWIEEVDWQDGNILKVYTSEPVMKKFYMKPTDYIVKCLICNNNESTNTIFFLILSQESFENNWTKLD